MAIMGAVFKAMAKKGLKKLKDKKEKEEKGKSGAFRISKTIKRKLISAGLYIFIVYAVISVLAGGNKDKNDKIVDRATAAFYALTGQPQTSSYAEYDIPLDLQLCTITIGENRRYNLEFNITDEDKQVVLQFLEKYQIELTEENIEFLAAFFKVGTIEIEEFATKEKLESLLLFFKADIASRSLDLRLEDEMYKNGEYVEPSFEEEGIPGIIRVNQYRINPENNATIETHLTYIPESEFNENTAGHFTINEGGNLVVANSTQTTVIYEYPEGYTGEKEENIATNTNRQQPVDFKPIISKSSLPFRFMFVMLRNINDAEFYQNIAKTVSKSSIVLALKEEETEEIRETIRTYTPRIEEYYDFSYIVSYNANTANTTIHTENNIASIGQARAFLRVNYGYTGMFESGVDEWDWNGAHYRATYNSVNKKLTITKTVASGNTISEPERKEEPLKPIQNKLYTKLTPAEAFNVKETTTTKTYKQEVEIKEIKNWFMDYNIEGYGGEASTNTDGPNEITIDIPEYDGVNKATYSNFETQENIPDDSIMKTFREQKENEITNRIGYNPQYTWNINGINYKKTENFETKTSTIVTTTTTTITNGKEHKEYRKQDSEGSFLYYLDQSDSARGVFKNPEYCIFPELEVDTTTIDQVNILKYLLYLYTGEERFNVDPIDLNSLVGTIEFTNFGGGFNNIEYTVQFSWSDHDSYAKTVDGIEFYKLYGDSDSGQGNPTIGRGDINLCMHQDKLHRLDGKRGKYLINGTTVSTEEVDLDTYMKQQLGVSTYQEAKNRGLNITGNYDIWVEAAPLDEIANDIWNEFKTTTKTKLESSGIKLKEQQLDALVVLEYAAGYIYNDFINTYKSALAEGLEIDSPAFNRYIWNNFWKDATGHLRANDARFQTYVKGNYYGFKDSHGNHTVFTNNYNFVYYGHENETENFVFEENNISNGEFLAVAEELWRRVCRDQPSYEGKENWENILHGNPIKVIKCSGYVSAVVNLYGYDNIIDRVYGTSEWIDMDISKFATVIASGTRK